MSDADRPFLSRVFSEAVDDEDDYPPYGEPEVVGPSGDYEPEYSCSGSSSEEETEELQQLFDRMDTNNDGYITVNEMLSMERKLAQNRGSVFDELVKRQELADFLRQGDLNKDQKLDFREFVISMKMRSLPSDVQSSDLDDYSRRGGPRGRRANTNNTTRRSTLISSASAPSIMRERRRANTTSHSSTPVHDMENATAVIAPADSDIARQRLYELFTALDSNQDQLVELKDIITSQARWFADKPGGVSDERKQNLTRLKQLAQNGGPDAKFNLDSFSKLLAEDIRVTNEELKAACDFYVWKKVQAQNFDVSQMTPEEARVSLENLQRHLHSSLNTRPTANLAANAEQIQTLQRDLQLATSMTESLLEQYQQANDIVSRLEEQNRLLEDELKQTKADKREAQRKLKVLQVVVTDLKTEDASAMQSVKQLQEGVLKERDAHITQPRAPRRHSQAEIEAASSMSASLLEQNLSSLGESIKNLEQQNSALSKVYAQDKRDLAEAMRHLKEVEEDRLRGVRGEILTDEELDSLEVVHTFTASSEDYQNQLAQENKVLLEGSVQTKAAAQDVLATVEEKRRKKQLAKDALNALVPSETPEVETPRPVTSGDAGASTAAPAESKPPDTARARTHAERNQEFFFLTTLAVKMNFEARFKAQNLKPPPMIPTKKLYEAAMQARVPFQYYSKWIDRQLDNTARRHSATGPH